MLALGELPQRPLQLRRSLWWQMASAQNHKSVAKTQRLARRAGFRRKDAGVSVRCDSEGIMVTGTVAGPMASLLAFTRCRLAAPGGPRLPPSRVTSPLF
jgi:hypothetical protein